MKKKRREGSSFPGSAETVAFPHVAVGKRESTAAKKELPPVREGIRKSLHLRQPAKKEMDTSSGFQERKRGNERR